MNQSNPHDDLELLDMLLEEEGVELDRRDEIQSYAGPPELSHSQQRMWFLQQAEPENPAYNVCSAVQWNGPLNIDAAQQAIDEIVRRHDVLRWTFPTDEGRPVVRETPVSNKPIVTLTTADISQFVQEHEPDHQIAIIADLASEQANQPFDLASGPLLRVHLLQLAAQRHVAILTMHHIVTDGWSMGVFLKEFGELYHAISNSRSWKTTDLRFNYSDFSHWQKDWLQSPDAVQHLDWWKKQLSGIVPLELPTDRRQVDADSYQTNDDTPAGAVHAFTVQKETAGRLRQLAQTEDATLFMILLSAFQLLLHRLSHQSDIAVGTPIANRHHAQWEPLIGLFVNSLVMRSDFSTAQTFRELCGQVRNFALDAYARQDVPLDVLVQELAAERHSENPLFQVMFTLESQSESLNLDGIVFEPVEFPTKHAKFDLMLAVSETDDVLHAAFEYRTSLFDKTTIERIASCFMTLLDSVARAPDQSVQRVPLLSAPERQKLLVQWNQTKTDYPRNATVHQLFEQQVAASPDSTAIVFAGEVLTYAQLNQRANQFARLLRSYGVGPNSPVAVHLNRSAHSIVAMLGILKAGGFYVPLDPDYPVGRLALMKDDCQAKVLVTETRLVSELLESERTIVVDNPPENLSAQDVANLGDQGRADQTAYVIYTSGSTGQPKGVAVPHRGIVRLVRNTNYVDLQADDHIAQASNMSFDAATFEIWGALLNGAQLIGVDRDTMLSPPDLVKFIRKQRISTMFMTPVLFNQVAQQFPDAFGTMHQLFVGGDRVSPHWARAVLKSKPPQHLINGYGPTENTTFSICHEICDVAENAASVPIGSPISNTQAYVLDGCGQPVPIGVVGELYLGGDGLAKGYLHSPELNAERFVANPFEKDDGEKLYRTGDLVKWLPNGNLDFIGRRDGQVKIRGFRIELGEIEAALLRQTDVQQATVIALDTGDGQRELVAYIGSESHESLSPAEIRKDLKTGLPSYMVPARYLLLDKLPLNENGKVDRKQLPEFHETQNVAQGVAAAARTAEEQCLATIWQQLMNVAEVSIHDNYFELGGDSITAIQMVSRVKRAGWELTVASLFRNPTIAGLASHMKPVQASARGKDLSENGQAVLQRNHGEMPLTSIQRWFFETYQGDSHFNQSVLLESRERIDESRLRDALQTLQDRHDALRLTFAKEDNLQQKCQPPGQEIQLIEVDLASSDEPQIEQRQIADKEQANIDLTRGPLLRSVLFRGNDTDQLLLIVHHLGIDGVSWRIILEELQLLYEGCHLDELGEISTSFFQWAHEVERIAQSQFRNELPFWNQQTEKAKTLSPLPLDSNHQSGERCHGDAETVHVHLSRSQTRPFLTRANSVYQTEPQDLLLTALCKAIQTWTGSDACLVSLEGHGRELTNHDLDLTRTVGWFTAIYPLLLEIPQSDTEGLIQAIKGQLRRVPNKGTGYGMLKYLGHESLTTAPQICFNYLGQFGHAGVDDGLFKFSEDPRGQEVASDLPRAHALDFVALVGDGQLVISLEFSPIQMKRSNAENLLANMKQELLNLIDHCLDEAGQQQPCEAEESGAAFSDLERRVGGNVSTVYPLSPMQSGLLFESLLNEEDHAYFVQTTYRLRGDWELDSLQRSWELLSQRHEVLRSAFVHEDTKEPQMVVLQKRPPEFTVHDLRGVSAGDAEQIVSQHQVKELERGFDLERDVLMRIAVFRRGDFEFDLVWSYHHIILDGWCLGILFEELMQSYQSLVNGTPISLPPPTPLRHYVNWLAQQDRKSSLQYWSRYMEGIEESTSVPRWDATASGDTVSEFSFCFDETTSSELKRFAAQSAVTLSTVLQGLWGVLLQRHNDVDEAVFGAIVSGRPPDLDGVEKMVGVFINAIPVRVPGGDRSFRDVLKELQDASLEALSHSYLPLTDIQAATSLGSNLFDHLLVFENYPREFSNSDSQSQTALEANLVAAHDHTHYDLTVTIVPGDAIAFRISYRSAAYSDSRIAQLARHLELAAKNVIANPEQCVASIPIISQQERSHVLHDHQGPVKTAPGLTILDLLEQQTQRYPDSVALKSPNGHLTYRELNARTNHLAKLLVNRGVKPEDRVGLMVVPDERLVIAVIAVLKAGAAYVPLDPKQPESRTNHIVDDAECVLVLTEKDVPAESPVDAEASSCRPHFAQPEHLAYVIYTSGSTGRPKGCQIEHRQLMNYLTWANEHYFGEQKGGGSFALLTSVSFDMTVTSLFLPLIRGQSLHLFGDEDDITATLEQCLRNGDQIDSIKLTPSHISIIEQLELRNTEVATAIVGGEALRSEQVKILRRLNPSIRIFNEYGPTEATVGCICKEVRDENERITIGRPINNTEIYILDRRRRLVPMGTVGEIYIAGDSLARGYLGRDDLTEAVFVNWSTQNLAGAPAKRVYKTGDLGRWLPNGEIEYLGRNDNQVKIRGHRVELAEVESAIARCEQVGDVAVVCQTAGDKSAQLVAYVTQSIEAETLKIDQLRTQLRDLIPSYMVPDAFVQIGAIPLAASGKLDRASLPPVDADARHAAQYESPETPLEWKVAQVWSELLGVQRIGRRENFADLGGHSLKAIQLISQLNRRFGAKLSIKDIFETPTVAGQAQLLSHAERSSWSSLQPAPQQEDYPLSHAQQRLWILHQMQGDTAAYNIPNSFQIFADVDVAALQESFSRVIARHETLRTAFVLVEGEPRQKVLPSLDFKIEIHDLRTTENAFEPTRDAELEARRIVDEIATHPFDLAKPPLLRAAIIKLDGPRCVFAISMHHIIGDGWSMELFYKELMQQYESGRAGRPDSLEPLPIQYKDYTFWQCNADFGTSKSFWIQRLQDMPNGIALPYDFPANNVRDFHGGAETSVWTKDLVASLRGLAQKQRTSLSNVVLSLFYLLLYRWTKQTDLCVGISMANRARPELEPLIGFFVNVLPVRCELSSDLEFDELVDQVLNRVYEALEHQEYPFDLLVKELNPTRYNNRQPLVNVVYAFQNYADVNVGGTIHDDQTRSESKDSKEDSQQPDPQAFEFSFATSKFDLTLFVLEDEDRLHVTMEYDDNLFQAATIRRNLEILERFAEMISSTASE